MKTERINVAPKARPIHKEEPVAIKVERIAPKAALAKAVATGKQGATAMSTAMIEKFPWTSDTLAEELGMPVPSFRAWKMKAEQTGKIAKPARGSLLCIEDPEVKMRLRYSDAYLDKLKALRGNVRKQEPNVSAMQHAKLKVTIPVFDDQVAKFLVKKFKDEKGIEEYLKTHLLSLAKPALNKIEEIKKKYEAELAEAMSSF